MKGKKENNQEGESKEREISIANPKSEVGIDKKI